MGQIHDLTALEQAAAVRRRELSPVEIADHYLDRIERIGPRVGAFITVTAEIAREQARNAEKRVVRDTPEELPPLLGVPVPVKDLAPVAGVRWTSGSAAFADRTAEVDADAAARLRAAGTVLTGKTNTPEFGVPCYTENDIAPPARTPWDPSRSAGGSSGGAAAAVAAGLAPAAHASDGGGSIRIPASVCGLFGIKPSRGRITNAPLQPDYIGLSTSGPLARTVADAAALLDAMAGGAPGDYYAPPPSGDARTFLDHARAEPGRLRIGRFSASPVPGAEVHPEVAAGYEEASRLLASLGHEVEDVDPPFDASLMRMFEVVWAAMAVATPVPEEDEGRLRPITRGMRARARSASVEDYMRATGGIQMALRRAVPRLDAYDVLLSPTLAQLPAPVGYFASDDPREEFARMSAFTPFTSMFNVTGQPSASVPLHWTGEGLPVGVMLTGRLGEEGTLLSLSAQLERARPWAGRRPDLSALES
ncbi:amidase [Nocardiopsis suaedae]|uniref:Amidase n=1 Tax=Nocardiopsis suaedae TaxID=3018444 RepID=A0ABT4TL66_9ACTN|nr:amidase [Nocardiopsis suaedae]MDA2805351.1 amidase [Nocardiopsis suaedae]